MNICIEYAAIHIFNFEHNKRALLMSQRDNTPAMHRDFNQLALVPLFHLAIKVLL